MTGDETLFAQAGFDPPLIQLILHDLDVTGLDDVGVSRTLGAGVRCMVMGEDPPVGAAGPGIELLRKASNVRSRSALMTSEARSVRDTAKLCAPVQAPFASPGIATSSFARLWLGAVHLEETSGLGVSLFWAVFRLWTVSSTGRRAG